MIGFKYTIGQFFATTVLFSVFVDNCFAYGIFKAEKTKINIAQQKIQALH